MRAIIVSSVHHVCCGLQFMVNDYTGSLGTCLRQDVYSALCAHWLRPSEACYSSDTLIVSMDHSSRGRQYLCLVPTEMCAFPVANSIE